MFCTDTYLYLSFQKNWDKGKSSKQYRSCLYILYIRAMRWKNRLLLLHNKTFIYFWFYTKARFFFFSYYITKSYFFRKDLSLFYYFFFVFFFFGNITAQATNPTLFICCIYILNWMGSKFKKEYKIGLENWLYLKL